MVAMAFRVGVPLCGLVILVAVIAPPVLHALWAAMPSSPILAPVSSHMVSSGSRDDPCFASHPHEGLQQSQ